MNSIGEYKRGVLVFPHRVAIFNRAVGDAGHVNSRARYRLHFSIVEIVWFGRG